MPAMPWMFTGGLENHPDLVGRLSHSRPLWGCGPTSLLDARDPIRLAEVLRGAGLPALSVVRDPNGLPRDGSWLRKPVASAGGIDVRPRDDSLETRELRAESDSYYYYQRRVLGPSLSALFVGGEGGASLLGISRQLLGGPAGPFSYRGSIAPWPVDPLTRQQIARAGQAVASAFGLVGLFGLDLVLGGGKPWVVELNPRYTASVEVIELSLGVPLLEVHRIACQSGRRVVPTAEALARVVAKEIVYAEVDAVYSEVEPEPWNVPGDFEVPEAADLPWPGTAFRRGDPVVTVFGEGPTVSACLRVLRSRRADWRGRLRPSPLREE